MSMGVYKQSLLYTCISYGYAYWRIHIGVGFCVARSTGLGNARASMRGMSDDMTPTLFSYIQQSLLDLVATSESSDAIFS